ncbi:hypothetical protein [Simiduia agarivorans]|uniref:Lipoprotein n=1 Tax=Simiduia agarivorans (strain DSM 21679 / JCM 13881 / BCRC 17597 / SA1) TaxID=1117647 RepID=K4KM84_SIMAS|nr:hypothetical protein [Simiduia agarivorans]AFU99340.1 hypothetical protein M5M_10805 [Simiduia agarivorans SA1 = DSM 21679]
MRFLSLLSAVLFLLPLQSQAETTHNKLAALGLPENLPNFVLSSLTHDSAYIEHVIYTEAHGETEERIEGFLVYSKDERNNIDLRVKYDPAQYRNEKFLVDTVSRESKVQYRIKKYGSTYDPKTVQIVKLAEGKSQVTLEFSEYALPQDIAYFRHMVVTFTVENGVLLTADVVNKRSFNYDGKQISQYRQHIDFAPADTPGTYLLKSKQVSFEGEWKGKPYQMIAEGNFVAFYGDTGSARIMDAAMLNKVSDPRWREAKIELDQMLPFMADMVRQQGIDVPLPFGVSVNYRKQYLDLDFTSFSVGGVPSDVIENFFDPSQSTASVEVDSMSIRGDAFILPFWNMFGVIGKNRTQIDVVGRFKGVSLCLGIELPDGSCLGQSLEIPGANLPVKLDLDYETAAIGTTLAVGYRNYFGSVTATYTRSIMEDSTGEGTRMWVVAPVVGYQFTDWRAQLLLGAEYQDYSANMEGVVGELEYDIGIRAAKWSAGLGFRKEFGQHWNLLALYSTGSSRDSMTVSMGYRF